MNRNELGARLRQLRKSLGYTQQQVAEALGVHRPTISEIEAGRRDVTSDELFEFARLYVTSLSDLLSEPTPSRDQVETVLYRKPGLETPEAKRAVRLFMQRCKDERELEALLGIDPPVDFRTNYDLPYPQDKGGAIRQGEELARKERINHQLGPEPLRNPLNLLEKQGVRIGPLSGEDGVDVDGIYFETDELGPCVAVNLRNDDYTGFRAAFTAAHEYAHWLLHDVRVEEFNFPRGTGENELHEVRANAFAAAFLMPADGLRSYFSANGLVEGDVIPDLSQSDIVRAMDFFGVSRRALLYRLQNVGLMTARRAEELRADGFSPGAVAEKLGIQFRTQEYRATRLPVLAVLAWRKNLIGTGRAADFLGLDVASFKQMMNDIGESQVVDTDQELLGAAAVG